MSPLPLRRRARTLVAATTIAGLSAGLLAAAAPATAAPATAAASVAAETPDLTPLPEDTGLASRFSLAFLPDTQFYSRYSADQFLPRYGKDPFTVQTEWLTQNRDDLNISFMSQLGDIVDQSDKSAQWQAASNAIDVLDRAKFPYSIAPGNHDVRNGDDTLDDTDYDLTKEPFLQWFGPDRAATVSTFQSTDPTGMSQANIFEAEGQQYLVFSLSWRVSDQTLAWVQSVLDANPTMPAILTMHSLLAIDSDAESPMETEYGQELWDKIISKNDQIFLTVNGHTHGASSLVKTNDFGNSVTQVLLDYQMEYEGGNGYLGLFEFDLTNGRLNVNTVSPWVRFKPQENLTSYDQPVLTGRQQQFTVPIDFAQRFSRFNPGFSAGADDDTSISNRVTAAMLDGYAGPAPITTERPGDTDDYIDVPGTLALWRFNSLDGTIGEGDVIPDVVGGNDMTRADPATSGATDAEWSDVTVDKQDVNMFSSDGAAACFANSDRNTGRFSYLTTSMDAAINNADLSNGYTIETFVKMSADWTADKNQWSKFLTRTGNRSQIPGVPWSQWDYTASPTALGISNLLEFQFTSIPSETSRGDKTNWSGAIPINSWAHVALVNDPATQATTMYVNGAPVLRNATQTAGMAFNAGMSWILGADWVNDGATNGWNGCIGETRIIDRPTTPDQWLTQRPDLTGLTVDEAPAGELPAGTSSVRFAGTGLPGAEVRLSLGDAQTVVDENGNWSIDVTEGLDAGAYDVQITQAHGTRAADPLTASFTIPVDLNVDVTTTTRTIAGKKYVSVVATSGESAPVAIVIDTPFGSKTFPAVQPGKSASVAFNSRATSIDAGEVTVTVTGTVDGEQVTVTKTAAYPAS